MRRALLVFALNEGAYLPLLRALACGDNCDLHLAPASLVAPARAEGIAALDACAGLDAAATARIEAERSRLIGRLAHLEATLARSFVLEGRSLWRRLREPFVRTLLDAAREVATVTVLVEALARDGALAGVVLGFDTIPAGRAAVAAARRLGVPTIHVPHAVLGRPRVRIPWQGSQLYANVVCAPGEFSRAGYLAAGARPEAIALTGSPRWDQYAALDEPARLAHRAAVSCALRLDPSAPILVYGPSWLERSTANSCRHLTASLDIYQGVLAAVRAHAARGVQLVVKLHPGELGRPGLDPASLLEGYAGVARRAGVERIAITAGYKEELLAAADLVLTVNSNLALEALLCGRPVVNAPLLAEEADVLFAPQDGVDGGVLALRHAGETAAAVSQVLADAGLRARLAARAGETVHRYVHAPDGHASERVASLVRGLAGC